MQSALNELVEKYSDETTGTTEPAMMDTEQAPTRKRSKPNPGGGVPQQKVGDKRGLATTGETPDKKKRAGSSEAVVTYLSLIWCRSALSLSPDE